MHGDEPTRTPLIDGLEPSQLATLESLLHRETFRAGDVLFRQGDLASKLYVLESGEVVIRCRPEDGGSLDIATISPGGIFGWSAALGRARYTSSAVCKTDGRALAMRGEALRRIMSDDPRLGERVLEKLLAVVAGRFEGLRTQLKSLLMSIVL